jgi:flagellar hook-associated protein 1 FlgK
VDVTDVQRVRNEFLEGRGRAERAQNAYLAEEARVYAGIESVFAEPSDTALQAQLADLWAGFDDVANNPGDGGARGALLETAATVADGLNNAYSALGSQWGSMRDQLDAHATDVNTAASTIAKLNETIRRARAGDLPVNELADQRDGLLMHLSETIGATAKFRDDGTVDVYLGGSTLVNGANAQRIEVGGARRLEDLGGDPLTVRFAGSGVAAPAGGTMGSAAEALTSIIPAYGARLDDVAAKLANSVNAVHTTGFGLDGVAGRPMFTGTTAATIKVALTDGAQIAASTQPGGSRDNTNANTLARLGSSVTGPDRAYRELIANLGVESRTAIRRSDIQAAITAEADAARNAESGVSLDEEMTNLLSYQRAYEAASRVISTVDEVLDVLINRMAV